MPQIITSHTQDSTQNKRLSLLKAWLNSQQQYASYQSLDALPLDASFRRYFRITVDEQTYVAMDAPPQHEDCHPFVAVAACFRAAGLQVPEVLASSLEQGFLLLTDFGDKLMRDGLSKETADSLYQLAIDQLLILQQIPQGQHYQFLAYDSHRLMEECRNFKIWFLEKYLKLTLTASDEKMLEQVFETLVHSASQQPQCCVHRDFQTRNLMVLEDGSIGIIDFQDAMWGPVCYDLVSLLDDYFIAWPKQKIDRWAEYYFDKASYMGKLTQCSEEQFFRWFNLMGVQRHLKDTYRFALKYCRDNKPQYMNYVPKVLNYALEQCECYDDLADFHDFLQEKILPMVKN